MFGEVHFNYTDELGVTHEHVISEHAWGSIVALLDERGMVGEGMFPRTVGATSAPITKAALIKTFERHKEYCREYSKEHDDLYFHLAEDKHLIRISLETLSIRADTFDALILFLAASAPHEGAAVLLADRPKEDKKLMTASAGGRTITSRLVDGDKKDAILIAAMVDSLDARNMNPNALVEWVALHGDDRLRERFIENMLCELVHFIQTDSAMPPVEKEVVTVRHEPRAATSAVQTVTPMQGGFVRPPR